MKKTRKIVETTDIGTITVHGSTVVDYLEQFVDWWSKCTESGSLNTVSSPDIEGARKILKMCRPLPACANEG